jgi:hypothetical protein
MTSATDATEQHEVWRTIAKLCKHLEVFSDDDTFRKLLMIAGQAFHEKPFPNGRMRCSQA